MSAEKMEKPPSTLELKKKMYMEKQALTWPKKARIILKSVSRLSVQFFSVKDLASKDANLSPDSASYTTHELTHPHVFIRLRIFLCNT